MVEEDIINNEVKDELIDAVVPVLEEEKKIKEGFKKKEEVFDKGSWLPKTELGRKVKSGEISDINDIIDNGYRILEKEIVDVLLPNLESDLVNVGQSRGKFGGGKRSIWRQTQKKTKEGNKPKFTALAVVGNVNGYVGLGYGKAKETVPAREKALRNAKLNIIKIRRGCGSWECLCKKHHSIPYTVKGKVGSVVIELYPAPKGTGLVVEEECARLLRLAGIEDVYSKTFGQTKRKMNLLQACFKALANLTNVKVQEDFVKLSGMVDGKVE